MTFSISEFRARCSDAKFLSQDNVRVEGIVLSRAREGTRVELVLTGSGQNIHVWWRNVPLRQKTPSVGETVICTGNPVVNGDLIGISCLQSDVLNKSEAMTDKLSQIDHISHYNMGSIEVIDAIEDWDLNFSRGTAVKYIARAGHKSKEKEIEDLAKAKWYIEREIERLQKEKKDSRET